jgi:adenylate cyclase
VSETKLNRRLTTIVAADVAAYSRLIANDEEATLQALQAHRRELIDPLLLNRGGRIANTAGDSLLIEFSSVIEAIRFSAQMQQGLRERNTDVPDSIQINFRIGIHVGDVVEQSGDLLGDGVNIAARLESLAIPGGIDISANTYEQVRSRLEFDVEDLGFQKLKNIPEPVRTYRLLFDRSLTPVASKSLYNSWRALVIAGIIVMAAIIFAWWPEVFTQVETDGVTNAPVVADRPTIAVLPFTNLSEDKAQEYFADGMTEDILTDLSKVSGLQVTSRSATLRYKKQDVTQEKMAADLGVRYLLEGSVRRANNFLRISAQLTDTQTQTQIWAERYDRSVEDIFAIQDEISEKVVAELSTRLSTAVLKKMARTYTPVLQAYDAYIQGRAKRIPPTPPNLAAAIVLFQRSIELDEAFAGGYSGLSYVHSLYAFSIPSPLSPDQHLEKALSLAVKAAELDDTFGPAHGSLAEAYFRTRQFDEAFVAIHKAMLMAPSDSLMRASYGRILTYSGEPEKGVEQLQLALRMSPDSLPPLYFLGQAYRVAGRFEEAVDTLTEHRSRLGGRIILHPAIELCAALVQMGKIDAATSLAQVISQKVPKISLAFLARANPYNNSEHLQSFLSALRTAGIPEN